VIKPVKHVHSRQCVIGAYPLEILDPSRYIKSNTPVIGEKIYRTLYYRAY